MNKNTILGFAIGPIGAALLGIITLPILAWHFSAEDIGRITMLQVASSFAVIFFSLGLDQAYVREYHESKDRPLLVKSVILPGLMGLLGILCLLSLFDKYLLSNFIFSIDSALFGGLIALALVAAYLSRFLSLILRMAESGLAFSMSQVLPKALFLLAIVGAYFWGLVPSFSLLLVAHVIAIVFATLLYGFNTRAVWLPGLLRGIDKAQLSLMLKFGLPLVAGGVASWLLLTIDKIFLRSFSTLSELGIYSVASIIASAVGIMSGIFTTVWTPTVYKWVAEGSDLSKVDSIIEYVLAAVIFIMCMAGLFSWIVVLVLPEMYSSVQYIVVLCMLPPLFYALSEVTAIGLGISRKSIFSMISSFVAVIFSVAINYYLVPLYGALGASIGMALSFWIFLIVRTEFSCLVWRKVSRLKVYGTTLSILILAILFVLYGEGHFKIFMFAWLCAIAMSVMFLKRAWFGAYSWVMREPWGNGVGK